tara:strand:+ start:6985 stop:7761 length:777 start_codon:yes stop_codon:yes gene_type:complete
MSVLSSEQSAAFANAVSGEEPREETEIPASEPVEAEAPEEEVAEEEPGESGDEEDHPHQVPYNRFRDVIEARNHYKSHVQQLEEELLYAREEAQRQPQAHREPPRQPRQEEDPWAELVGDLGSDGRDYSDPDDVVERRLRALEGNVQNVADNQAERQLEHEVQGAVSQYPHVPPNAIYQAIANDGRVSAEQAARDYTEFVSSIEEAAIASYVSDSAKHKQSAAKRPDTSSGRGAPKRELGKALTMTDAREALLAALKD